MSNLDLSPSEDEPAGPSDPGNGMLAVADEASVELPGVGELAYDSRSDRVGEVMELRSTHAVLRPPGGGLEWEVPLGYVHPGSHRDDLRARVAERNANSRWGL